MTFSNVSLALLGAVLGACVIVGIGFASLEAGPYCPGDVPDDWLGYCAAYSAK